MGRNPWGEISFSSKNQRGVEGGGVRVGLGGGKGGELLSGCNVHIHKHTLGERKGSKVESESNEGLNC